LNVSRQKLFILITLLLGICLATGGCNAQKAAKPLPGTPKEVANLVETEAVKVEGVKKAAALVSDRTIYVGLELKDNYDKQKITSIEQSVLDRTAYLEPDYNIGVTSDMALVTKIKDAAMRFEQGTPLSGLKSEITQIGQGVKLTKEAVNKETGRPGIH